MITEFKDLSASSHEQSIFIFKDLNRIKKSLFSRRKKSYKRRITPIPTLKSPIMISLKLWTIDRDHICWVDRWYLKKAVFQCFKVLQFLIVRYINCALSLNRIYPITLEIMIFFKNYKVCIIYIFKFCYIITDARPQLKPMTKVKIQTLKVV